MTEDQTTALVNLLPDPDTRRALAVVVARHETLVDEVQAAKAALEAEAERLRAPMLAREAEIEARLNIARSEMRAEYDRKLKARIDEHDVEMQALSFDEPTSARLDAIDAELDAIDAGFEGRFEALDREAMALVWVAVEDIPLCALTGLPLLDGDGVLADEDTGDRYLRLALGLPPHDPETGEVLERMTAVPFEGDDAGFNPRQEVA